MYTKIGGKCIDNDKIVPENDLAYDNFGCSVDLSGSTDLFGAPVTNVEREKHGPTYAVDLCVP